MDKENAVVEEEFLNDEDVEEALMNLRRNTEKNDSIENIVSFAYKLMKYIVRNVKGAYVSYSKDFLIDSFHFISVESSEEVSMTNKQSKWFIEMADMADNVEIYPMTNGKFIINIGFYKMTGLSKEV